MIISLNCAKEKNASYFDHKSNSAISATNCAISDHWALSWVCWKTQCLNLTAVELDYENDTKSGKTLLLMPDMFVQTIIYHYNPEIYILKLPRKRLDS